MIGGEWLRANVGLGSVDDKSYAGPLELEMNGISFQLNMPLPICPQPKEFGDNHFAFSFTSNAALDSDACDTCAFYQWAPQPAHEIHNQRPSDQDFQSFVICALIT